MNIRLVPCLAASLLLAACSHARPAAVTPVAARPTTPSSVAPAATVAPTTHADSVRAEVARDENRAPAPGAWGVSDDDSTALARRLRFDYDRAELTDPEIAKLEAKRAILERNPTLVIRIAGNADERGPDEYNLALGLRRAAAAKRWLTFHGIAENRISIVSYGEEQPLDDGHDESAWQRNRRDDFLVVGPPAK